MSLALRLDLSSSFSEHRIRCAVVQDWLANIARIRKVRPRIGICPELSGQAAKHFNGNSFTQFGTNTNPWLRSPPPPSGHLPAYSPDVSTYALIRDITGEDVVQKSLDQTRFSSVLFAQQHHFHIYSSCHFFAEKNKHTSGPIQEIFMGLFLQVDVRLCGLSKESKSVIARQARQS